MLPSSNAEVEKVLGKTNYAVDHEQVAKVTPRKLQPLNTSSTKNNPHPLKVINSSTAINLYHNNYLNRYKFDR